VARCTAKTRAGTRCRRKAGDGGCCHAHSGAVDVGRPDGLTAAVHERIVRAVRVGAGREVAAQEAGVDVRTLQRWLARGAGEDADERFRALAVEVERAGAQREIQAHAHIARAGAEDWRAEAWYLRYVRGYAGRHEHSGPDGGPIPLDVAGLELRKLSDAELDELRRICAKGRDYA
jgi:hypothetical protein